MTKNNVAVFWNTVYIVHIVTLVDMCNLPKY